MGRLTGLTAQSGAMMLIVQLGRYVSATGFALPALLSSAKQEFWIPHKEVNPDMGTVASELTSPKIPLGRNSKRIIAP